MSDFEKAVVKRGYRRWSTELKELIVSKRKEGLSLGKIGKMLNVPIPTVSSVLRKYNTTGSVLNIERCKNNNFGRKASTIPRNLECLVDCVLLPEVTISTIPLRSVSQNDREESSSQLEMDADDTLGEEVERRGRKRKNQTAKEIYQQLPNCVTEGLAPEVVEELQYSYEILQTIMSMSRIDPFLLRPNPNLFGLASYYSVIKTPMWLNEVERKLFEREYMSITEFVADIKLMLENCYKFWGCSHKFSRKGFRIESKLEQKIDALPERLKKKLEIEDPSPNEIVIQTEIAEVNDSRSKEDEEEEEDGREEDEHEIDVKPIKGFQSKILSKIMDLEAIELVEENNENQKIKESEMLEWEKTTLVSDELREEMKSMWQLAEIGHFLRLTYEVLNVEEVSQYEVERMFLMPIESTTLATLMTSMLSPAAVRPSLDVTPVMPYEIWSRRLKKKVEDWFSIYYKKCDAVETYRSTGIDPHFWEVMGLVSPLETKCFHEIDFFQRVWIFKSLCSYLLHTTKCIQDVFMDDSCSDLRETKLGSDKEGYEYFWLPFLPEIRVYKQRDTNKVWSSFVYPENLVTKLMSVSFKFVWNEEEKIMKAQSNGSDFMLVADDMPSLLELSDCLKNKTGVEDLVKRIAEFIKLAKKYRQSLEGLEALYTQWHEFQNKPALSTNEAQNHWEINHNITEPDHSTESAEVTEVLGKRRTKISLCYADMVMGDESDEDSFESESEGSDWECAHNKKKKKKGTPKKQPKHDEPEPVIPTIMPDPPRESWSPDEESNLIKVKEELTIDYPDVKPGQQMAFFEGQPKEFIDVKPVVVAPNPTIRVIEQLVPFVKPPQDNPPPIAPPLINTNIIKAEVEDDVISISSDEEKDVKPNIKLLQKNKAPVTNPTNVSSPIRPVYNNQPVTLSPPVLDNINMLGMQPGLGLGANLAAMLSPRKTSVPMWRQPQLQLQARPQLQLRPQAPLMQQSPPQGQLQRMNSPFNNFINTSPISPQMMSPQQVRQQVSPRVRGQYTPRQRSPSIRSSSPRTPTAPHPPFARRKIFQPTPPKPIPQPPKVPSIEGQLEVGLKPDGSYGYHVRLPDGGIIQMSRAEIEEIRKKNKGSLPQKVQVPLIKKPGQFII